MLKKLYFLCSRRSLGKGSFVQDNNGLAHPIDEENIPFSELPVYEIVEIDEEHRCVLCRQFQEFDEQSWAEISGAYDIKTDPTGDITKNPVVERNNKRSEVLIAVIEGEMTVIQGDRVRIVGYRTQAGIVDAVPSRTGKYVITEIIAEMTIPRKGVWVQIEPDYVEETDKKDEKVKVRKHNE